ncbi:protein of unknown function [Chitinophaga rupis]|uniref:DUF305 domain-containing protein n=2 Tax=Chitinophaga rupis TaxID=573321 RepID=A0A1H7RA83_9BACT|nr:protein of unknown function [Chitinophaga rupis]
MHHTNKTGNANTMQYKKLLLMVILSYIAMYILMYSMVDRLANVIPNINQFYMAGLMAAPMAIIELALMGSMYKNRKLNLFIILISCIVLIMCFLFIRNQTAVSERQFLKSMIPHHASAILMVKETEISDPEIKQLANDIISSQQKEIEFMKAKLKEMDKK